MEAVKCPKCGRILGKFDCDGFHVKTREGGPQVYFAGDNLRIMFVCPSKLYTPRGKIECGERTMIQQ